MHGKQKRTTVCTLRLGKACSFVFAISRVLFPAVCSPDTCPAHLHMTEGLEISSFPRKTIIQPKKILALGILRKQASHGEKNVIRNL